MEQSSQPLSVESQAIKDAYAALNRGDVEGFIRIFDPEVERIEPASFPGAGTYHGLDAVRAHVNLHRGNWAEGGCEPTRFIVVGNRVVVLVQVRVRLKNETDWREGEVGDVYTFRNGRVIQFRTFFSAREALDYAGVGTASDP